ncbi:MAG: substrate-binding domain-containing protein [Treponemataceae bacterium]
MKLLIRLGIIIFGLASIVSFSISLFLVREMYVQGIKQKGASPRNHFALYLPDNRDAFFTEIIRGAERAAAESGTIISVHSIDPARAELAMASYTGVDGVVVCPYLDDGAARRQLSKLTAKKIPLVLINHNVPNEQPWPYIGANNFDVGRRMGAAAKNLNRSGIRLAVVYSDKSPGIFAERELVEMGITASLKNRLAAPITGLKTGLNPLDAEAMIYGLFRTASPINTLVFTDSIDTVAAAQALIDMNLVGRVQIIGFGNSKGILEYIRKGIIAGSVVVNPEKIGYEAIKSLKELRDTGYTSTAVDAGVELVDRSRL